MSAKISDQKKSVMMAEDIYQFLIDKIDELQPDTPEIKRLKGVEGIFICAMTKTESAVAGVGLMNPLMLEMASKKFIINSMVAASMNLKQFLGFARKVNRT